MKFTLAISNERMPFASNRLLQVLTVAFAAIWISTLTGTTDLNNWMLENTLTILFLIFLATTFRKYRIRPRKCILP
ncbi:MAG: hypothetical protein IT266_03775 [Saprospiraceae bacterium]|nr:hypothetical protein [Saprospiraceae bacterium]